MRVNKLGVCGFVLVVLLCNVLIVSGATMEDVSIAINESYSTMVEMQSNNFSINYVNDSLSQAKMVFEQARYAEILRGNASEAQKSEARSALRLVDWRNINYDSVLYYTSIIEQRKKQAYLISDRISVSNDNLDSVSNNTLNILENAKVAFYEERYNDSQNLLDEFRTQSEKERALASSLNGIRGGAKEFFKNYGIVILVLLIFFVIVGYLIYKKFEKKILGNRIIKMKAEWKVLDGLIKKLQEERFRENKISGLVYNIRLKKYEERQEEIKEELPVLEAKWKELQ